MPAQRYISSVRTWNMAARGNGEPPRRRSMASEAMPFCARNIAAERFVVPAEAFGLVQAHRSRPVREEPFLQHIVSLAQAPAEILEVPLLGGEGTLDFVELPDSGLQGPVEANKNLGTVPGKRGFNAADVDPGRR